MRSVIVLLSLLATSFLYAAEIPLEAWLKRQSAITSLDTEFIQERKLPALKNPTTTPGRLSFLKPGKVRWQLGKPFETLAVSDGTTMTLLDAASNTARRIPVDSPQAVHFSMLSGKSFESLETFYETFYETFEVIDSRVTSGIHQYTLKPGDRRLRIQIPWMFLDIDPTKNELRALEFELQDKSRLRTVFQKMQFNLKLEESLFKPDLSDYIVK